MSIIGDLGVFSDFLKSGLFLIWSILRLRWRIFQGRGGTFLRSSPNFLSQDLDTPVQNLKKKDHFQKRFQ